MKKKYDLLFPFGNSCIASDLLRLNKLQCESYPFDWIANFDFDKVILAFEMNLAHMFDPQYLEEIDVDGMHIHYRNTFYNFVTMHDFYKNASMEENVKKNTEKYQRRLERLKYRIAKANSILIVHSERGNFELDDAKIKQQYERIKKSLPANKNIDLLVINFRTDTKENNKYNIDDNISKVVVAVEDLDDYKSLKTLGKPFMDDYDTFFYVKARQALLTIARKMIRKPLLKIAVALPMPQKYKQRIRKMYKDRFAA